MKQVQHSSRSDIAADVDASVARILLADDDQPIRSMLAIFLRRNGFEVMEAKDGVEAVEIVASNLPDIAVVDLRMPRMDGLEVVQTLKSTYHVALPVLVVSGEDDRDARIQAFEAGADDFISKPVHMQELLKRINAFERTRQAYAEAQLANERADRLRLFGAEAAALLAHDLNNGLCIATANLQYLEENLALAGDEKESMAAASRAIRRMIGLVRNFVDISRLEDAAITPDRSDVDIHELLSAAAMIHYRRKESENHGIELEVEPKLTANIDPVLIERVVHNLLNNATRYVNPGGRIALIADVRINESNQRELHISVGNTGKPIPVELRNDLFSKYRKGNDGKAQCGMGLYFCRLVCEAHGGNISCTETDRFNTLFHITIPC